MWIKNSFPLTHFFLMLSKIKKHRKLSLHNIFHRNKQTSLDIFLKTIFCHQSCMIMVSRKAISYDKLIIELQFLQLIDICDSYFTTLMTYNN